MREELPAEAADDRVRLVLGDARLQQLAHPILEVELEPFFRHAHVVVESRVANRHPGLGDEAVEHLPAVVTKTERRRPEKDEDPEEGAVDHDRGRVSAREPVRLEPLARLRARIAEDIGDIERPIV